MGLTSEIVILTSYLSFSPVDFAFFSRSSAAKRPVLSIRLRRDRFLARDSVKICRVSQNVEIRKVKVRIL